MTDNLLVATSPGDASKGPGAAEALPPAEEAPRPEGIPDKFWDEQNSRLRTDALVKSYLELERRLGGVAGRDAVPQPEEYAIELKNEVLTVDEDVNNRLRAAGFSQEQAQLVYDLASERLMPMVSEIASIFEADSQISRLEKHFGGEQRWRETARQIDAWGRSHLPARVMDALATTYEGVLVLHRMMTGDEPGLLPAAGAPSGGVSETEIKQLMRDPRYWRHQEPAVVEKVREGFRRLYQDQR